MYTHFRLYINYIQTLLIHPHKINIVAATTVFYNRIIVYYINTSLDKDPTSATVGNLLEAMKSELKSH